MSCRYNQSDRTTQIIEGKLDKIFALIEKQIKLCDKATGAYEVTIPPKPSTPANFFKPSDFDMTDDPRYAPAQAADIANRILAERGVRVYGRFYANESPKAAQDFSTELLENAAGAEDTHSALLVCVEPLRKDTMESLLREFIAYVPGTDTAERARKLLEEK